MIGCPACGFRASASTRSLPPPPRLPGQESRIFRALLERAGQTVPLDTLIGAVYLHADEPADARHVVQVRIRMMRERLREAAYPASIINERSIGYRLEAS